MPWKTDPWTHRLPVWWEYPPSKTHRRIMLFWPPTGHGVTLWVGPPNKARSAP
jgi:hypothetical protein